MERNWLDSVMTSPPATTWLDGITFDDIITQVHCKLPQHHAPMLFARKPMTS